MLEPAVGALTCAAAGHPGPACFRVGAPPPLLELSGPPVGLTEDAAFEEARVELAPGDRIVFFSDGVSEALDPQMQPYGPERMLKHLSIDAPLAVVLEGVLRDVKEHATGGTQGDLAMLGLEVEKK